MKVKVKKVWLGHVSVRNYIVEKCIRMKEDLIIEHNGSKKTFPYRSLKTYLLNSSGEMFISKFNGKKYKLIDFPWESVRQMDN